MDAQAVRRGTPGADRRARWRSTWTWALALLLAAIAGAWPPAAHAAARTLAPVALPPTVELRVGMSQAALPAAQTWRHDRSGREDADAQFRRAREGGFLPLPGGQPTFGFDDGAHWLYSRIANRDHAEQRWLLVLEYALIDHIDVYVRYPDGRVSHQAGGDALPFTARAIRYRHPNFWIHLPHGADVELLVRVQSQSSVQAPLGLYTPSAFTELARDAQFSLGLFEGILLALFLYNLVLWISLRDESYFWYMGHVAAFGLVMFCVNGLAFEYLWPQSPRLANVMVPLSMCASQAAMHQFSRQFLELDRRWPLGDRIALGFLAVMVALSLATPFIDYRASVQLGTALVFPTVGFILLAAVKVRRGGFVSARLFLLAWSALLLGTTVYALLSFGLLPKTFLTEYGIQVGAALEVILLSFALAHRYGSLRAENERVVREANEGLERNVARRTRELSHALEQLAEANGRLRDASRRDALTGLFNRRHFHEIFDRLVDDAREARRPIALLICDLDFFKRINDTHGHLVGDECLKHAARRLLAVLEPEQAVVARFGGEEFVAVLPGTDQVQALRIGERLRAAFDGHPVDCAHGPVPLTLSIGVCSFDPERLAGAEQALRAADDALYAAKQTGRNCVRSLPAAHAPAGA